MRAYEFECTDNPGVFFAHLERSLSGGAWQQNEHLVWLNRLTAQRTMALYERAGARLSVIAGGERGGRWHYTIIFREMNFEQA